MTFFPGFWAFERLCNLGDAGSDEHVTVPKDVITLLIRYALKSAPFDIDVYLDQNPDVRSAWERGEIENLKTHFTENGYFEGRQAMGIDIEWYSQYYPDVADYVVRHPGSSAEKHYKSAGEKEWRAPNANAQHSVSEWRDSMLKLKQD